MGSEDKVVNHWMFFGSQGNTEGWGTRHRLKKKKKALQCGLTGTITDLQRFQTIL